MSRTLDEIVDEIDRELSEYGVILDNWQAKFGKNYGWHSGEQYTESGASVADVIRFEREEYDNEDVIPYAPMEALEKFKARDGVWLCATREKVRQYRGTPYRVRLSKRAFIAAEDGDGGYYVVDPNE